MVRFRPLSAAVVVLVLGVAAAASAQSPNSRRQPKQTHDKGTDDAVPPGQERKIGERNAAAVTVVTRPDGTRIAHLDESFHDALVATKGADGKITYTCVHGIAAAEGKVQKHAPAQKTPTAGAEVK